MKPHLIKPFERSNRAAHRQRSTILTVSAVLAFIACSSTPESGSSGSSTSTGGGGSPSTPSSTSSSSSSSATGVPPDPPPPVGGLGAAELSPGDLDAPSNGGTITFEQIGAPGWYPSRRDPESGPCDAYQADGCCLAKASITSDALTPWDSDLIMTLRGPLQIKQFAAYQRTSSDSAQWSLVSGWDDRDKDAGRGIAFEGNAGVSSPFAGTVGSECLVNVSLNTDFGCGAGSVPYCPTSAANPHLGWSGSKLFVLLAKMPHAGSSGAGTACSQSTDGNWYDAPWIGLSVGELIRSGAFSNCQCYAKDPSKGYLGDGCGQFNVLEVVNDNNQFKNLDVFSTNMIGYGGYVGQGPCGSQCNVSALGPEVDLIDKATNHEAAEGAVATPSGGPNAALRRPESGYRYFFILLDVPSRTVALGIVHPSRIPEVIAPLVPGLPNAIPNDTVDALRALRLPGR